MIILWILVALVLFAFLFFHAFTFAIRWHEEGRRSRDERGIGDLSPREVLPILAEMGAHAIMLALWVVDLIAALRHYPWRRRMPLTVEDAARAPAQAKVPPPGRRPVLLLHGLGMRGLTMYPLARKLRRDGFPVRLFTYWPPGTPLEACARQFHDFVEALCREEGWREFDAVGHSAGGIVLRRYLAVHDGARRLRRIVTIGTPHGGSVLWRFSFLAAGRQLRPGGEFLRHLDEAGLPPGVEATAIASRFDPLVIPNANARWEAPGVRNHTIRNAGHVRLLYHSETYRLVREALR